MSYTILIVDDEEHARINISEYLAAKGYDVKGVPCLADAREILRHGAADIVLLDVRLPDGYGPNLLEETARMPVRPPVIMITAYGDIEMAVDAMKAGAHDFFQKPIQMPELEKSILRAVEIVALRAELAHLRQAQNQEMDFIIGKSPALITTLDHARRAAQVSASVLITGQTGTGKEVLAHAIHQMGPRKNKPFIALNCSAIQPTVLESELFGYEPGAFTGADKRKKGLMEVADGGILFLDEIASMPMEIQTKLLRVLGSQSFYRVGATQETHVDVQVLAASNRDLKAMIAANQFRDDLYFRLKVVDIELPPLKERKEDIPDLVGLFIRDNNSHMGINITNITPQAMKALVEHTWPGNIRELRNVIERAMILCDCDTIDLGQLPQDLVK